MNTHSPRFPPSPREASVPHPRDRVSVFPVGPRPVRAQDLRLRQPSPSSAVPRSTLHWLTFLCLLPAFAVQAWWAPLQAAGNGLPKSLPADCACVACPAACCRTADDGGPISEPFSLPTSRTLLPDEVSPLLAGASFLPLRTSSDPDPGRSPMLRSSTAPSRVPLFLRIRALRI